MSVLYSWRRKIGNLGLPGFQNVMDQQLPCATHFSFLNRNIYCDDLLYQVCYKIGADNSLVELSDSRGAVTEELHPRNFIQGISLVFEFR